MNIIKRWLRTKHGKCFVCGTQMVMAFIPLCHGTYQGIEVDFEKLPCFICPKGCKEKRYAESDFGAELIEAIYYKGYIPITSSGALNSVSCMHCKANCKEATRYAGIVSGSIIINRLQPFTLRIQGQIIKCMLCNAEQFYADEQISSNINDAIIEAFKMVDLRPL